MEFLFLDQWFSDQLIKAFCWTLVHSLWQGLIAAALAGMIIIITRQSSPRTRYNLLGAVFILFLAGSAITFYNELGFDRSESLVANQSVQAFSGLTFTSENPAQQNFPAASTIENISAWLNSNAGLFMSLWAVFFAFNCLKLVAGIGSVQRLCHYRTREPGIFWQEKLNDLAIAVAAGNNIKLLQSELVKVPVTIGFFKPVILVPLGMLAQIPAEQVETILLHELAHIRRRDYAVNLLQKFAGAIYFFNPPVNWISSLIREEREACCDDIVMQNVSSKSSYVKALVSFEEFQPAVTNYAMSIGTKRNYLLQRVRRILTRENKKLNIMEKTLLITGLAVLMAFSVLSKKDTNNIVPDNIPVHSSVVLPPTVVPNEISVKAVKEQKKKPKKIVAIAARDTTDTTKKKKPVNYDDLNFPSMSTQSNDDGKVRTETITAVDQNGKKYTVNKLNDKVTGLIIDGKQIPEGEFGNHSSLLHRIDQTRQANKQASLRHAEERKRNADERKIAAKQRDEIARHQKETNREMARVRSEQSRLAAKQQDELHRLNDEHRKANELNRKEEIKLQLKQRQEMEKLREKNHREADGYRKEQQLYREQQRIYRLKEQEQLRRKLNNTTQTTNKYEEIKIEKLIVAGQKTDILPLPVKPALDVNQKPLSPLKVKPASLQLKPAQKANRTTA